MAHLSDAEFALDCWVDPEDEGEPQQTDYYNTLAELRDAAERVISGGRYKFVELMRKKYVGNDYTWESLETQPD